ncbi:mas-related G-protein coupled receptor member H-like [Heteronotia binoei]|uniref:mas-related G-protein coupled receptor member H-like n=1 Tax=Heteronotia binoei TaxID=13085 RepID=UPI002930D173|nr:mas-related G-protein coupled receptor member H-like [Heteronotia binoei]
MSLMGDIIMLATSGEDYFYNKRPSSSVMTNFSKSLSLVEDGPHDANLYNSTWSSSHNTSSGGPDEDSNSDFAIYIFMLSICITGLVGNGIVIYLLGFHIKRSPFTTYILNLAVADFGFLLFGALTLSLELTGEIYFWGVIIIAYFLIFTYTASQLLLTTISIDRCVSVLFPIWHQCHRPRHLSTIVCALMWALSFLTSGSITLSGLLGHFEAYWIFFSPFIAGSVVFFPLITVSTTILLLKLFCKAQQPRSGKLLTIVLLTLLFYFIFAFPMNAIYTVNYFAGYKYVHLAIYADLCACLNSCVNPVICFLVGKKKMGQRSKSLKFLLQRAFQEEEEHREECGTTALTSL